MLFHIDHRGLDTVCLVAYAPVRSSVAHLSQNSLLMFDVSLKICIFSLIVLTLKRRFVFFMTMIVDVL